MNIQFVGRDRPDGPVLFETAGRQVPREGDHVALPGYRVTVVRRVVWVWDQPGAEPRVSVVLG